MKTIAFTGHRPDKLPGGYNSDHDDIKEFIRKELGKVQWDTVLVGGALGIDQIAHKAAHYWTIGREDKKLVLVCEPFKGFWRKWPVDSIEKYMELKYSDGTDFIYVDSSEEYAPWKMQKRNEYMVDRCDELWAWWDGSDGGTANCVKYAKKIGKPVRNLFEEQQSARTTD